MLRLPSAWTWDFWCADDGDVFHVFYLKASRALLDPDRRHSHASVGHAVSVDLRTWTEVADALVPADPPAFDDLATWTGSVVRGDDGRWRMFYTGIDRTSDGAIQRIGVALSDDLYEWTRSSAPATLVADPRWYEQRTDLIWPEEHWRDPWVMRDPNGAGWHMLITARASSGAPDERGVVGHATSPDLEHWTVEPPLSSPGSGFGQLEVTQVETVDDRSVLIFSCMTTELSQERRATEHAGGIWAVTVDADHLAGPYDVSGAYRITNEAFYSGRLVRDRTGAWMLLAFRHTADDGSFVGELSDPMPVRWDGGGRLVVGEQAADIVSDPVEIY